jgi:hypothetical protein
VPQHTRTGRRLVGYRGDGLSGRVQQLIQVRAPAVRGIVGPAGRIDEQACWNANTGDQWRVAGSTPRPDGGGQVQTAMGDARLKPAVAVDGKWHVGPHTLQLSLNSEKGPHDGQS